MNTLAIISLPTLVCALIQSSPLRSYTLGRIYAGILSSFPRFTRLNEIELSGKNDKKNLARGN